MSPLTKKKMAHLATKVLATSKEECNCEQFIARLAELIDSQDQAAPSKRIVQAKQHLIICDECREEFDLVQRALRRTS